MGVIAKNGQVYGWSGAVDSALDSQSLNPVQNKVVTEAINSKKDTLTIDTALNTVSTNPVQNKAITNALGTYVRPNLLVNWYFVGGGGWGVPKGTNYYSSTTMSTSTLVGQTTEGMIATSKTSSYATIDISGTTYYVPAIGSSQFPVNQRGQTSYSGIGYTIDRWRMWQAALSMTLSADGVILANGDQATTRNQFVQYLSKELTDQLTGKPLTISAVINGVLYQQSGIGGNVFSVEFPNGSLQCGTGTSQNLISCAVYANIGATVSGIAAIKLELGSTQTLAHQENGVWVLNEIPDYGEQLARCQRYQVVYTTTVGECVGTGYALSASEARITFSLPQPLYRAPEFVIDEGDLEGLTLVSGTNGGSVSGMLTPLGVGNGLITLRVQSNGLSSGQVYALRAQTKKISFIIDANLL